MIIAISGPPTASETASLGGAVAHLIRRFDSEALHFTFDLCDSVPVAAHAAGLCAKPDVAVARAEPRGREIEVSAVSETLPPSAREILPPDTIDQIARATQHRSALLGEARQAPRLAHAHSQRANAQRARSLRATARRSTQIASPRSRRQLSLARAVRGGPHQGAVSARGVRRTITALRAQPASSPAHPPSRRTITPAPQATSAAESAPPPEPAPPAPEAQGPEEQAPQEQAPQEQANVAPAEHGPPPEQSDEDSQPNNPQSDEPPSEDIKS